MAYSAKINDDDEDGDDDDVDVTRLPTEIPKSPYPKHVPLPPSEQQGEMTNTTLCHEGGE